MTNKDPNYRNGWEVSMRAFIPFDPHEPATMDSAIKVLNGLRPSLQAAVAQSGVVVYVKHTYRERYRMPDPPIGTPAEQPGDESASANG
jgi:hypothetical protein